MSELSLVYRLIEELKPWPNNPRTHSDDQIAQLVGSMMEFGFTQPVLINEDDVILAGHGRLEAAQLANIESVPTVTVAGLTTAQQRAYVIADNQLALRADWSADNLQLELQRLLADDFDLTMTGFLDWQLNSYLSGNSEDGFGDGSGDMEEKEKKRSDDGISAFECVMDHDNKLRLLRTINKVKKDIETDETEVALMAICEIVEQADGG